MLRQTDRARPVAGRFGISLVQEKYPLREVAASGYRLQRRTAVKTSVDAAAAMAAQTARLRADIALAICSCQLPCFADVACFGFQSRFSRSSRASLRSTPQRYPEALPSLRITRWQGIATARLLAAQACATARTALGEPMRAAISA